MVDLNGCRKLPVYCNMDGAGLGDCGGGGWTLVMKINGAKVSTKLILLVGLTSYIVGCLLISMVKSEKLQLHLNEK